MLRTTFLLLLSLVISSEAFAKTIPIYAFRSYNNTQALELEIIGQVKSKSFSMQEESWRLLNFDTRPMVLTAGLIDPESIRMGDKVYIVEKDPDHQRYKNGYIVGQAEVYSVFNTEFQGWMMRASGNLAMVKTGHYVAIERYREERKDAQLIYARAEREIVRGNKAEAFALFRQSLQLDPERPETYLRLAELSDLAESTQMRLEYLQQAWQRSMRFGEAEDLLILPGLYIEARLHIMRSLDEEQRLKGMLALLAEVRDYQHRLQVFETSFSGEVLKMLHEKGIPDAEYQYQMGRLYASLSGILEENSLRKVVGWLSPQERNILYERISLPYRNEPEEDPQKSWDRAYIFAAIYHYELSHELNPMNTQSALALVRLSYRELNKELPQNKREYFSDILEHYGSQFLNVPSDPQEMAFVRNALKVRDQP